MNWEVCTGALPKSCLSVNELLSPNADIRLTNRFPPNKLHKAKLSIIEKNAGPEPGNVTETVKEIGEVTVLLTKSYIEGTDGEVIQLSCIKPRVGVDTTDKPVCIVHTFNEDEFVCKSRVCFRLPGSASSYVELLPIEETSL